MAACPASRRSGRPPSCTARRSWIRPKRRSATTGSIRPTSASAWSPPALVLDRVKLEASRFNGREPDQHRWNIETGPLDSTVGPPLVEPDANARAAGQLGAFHRSRAARARRRPEALVGKRDSGPIEIAPGWKAAATLAWGRKSAHGHSDDASRRGRLAEARGVDAVRPRRDDRESRAHARSRTGRPTGSARSRPAPFAISGSPIICRSGLAACSRSISCRTRSRRLRRAATRPARWRSCGSS